MKGLIKLAVATAVGFILNQPATATNWSQPKIIQHGTGSYVGMLRSGDGSPTYSFYLQAFDAHGTPRWPQPKLTVERQQSTTGSYDILTVDPHQEVNPWCGSYVFQDIVSAVPTSVNGEIVLTHSDGCNGQVLWRENISAPEGSYAHPKLIGTGKNFVIATTFLPRNGHSASTGTEITSSHVLIAGYEAVKTDCSQSEVPCLTQWTWRRTYTHTMEFQDKDAELSDLALSSDNQLLVGLISIDGPFDNQTRRLWMQKINLADGYWYSLRQL